MDRELVTIQNGQPESSKSTEKENDTKREGKQEKQQLLKMKGIQQETAGSVFKEDVYLPYHQGYS